MPLNEQYEYDCEVRGPYKAVQVRKARVIMDGDDEVARTYHRHVLHPRTKTNGIWGDTDISEEPQEIQNICNAIWTASIKSAYETYADAAFAASQNASA